MGLEHINTNEEEYLKEPKDGLIKYTPGAIDEIRREFNFDNKENREKAIAIIMKWIKQQDHFIKKDYSKGYIERCILTSKGSLERAKKQLDRMCTYRTLLPKYFQTTDIKNAEFMETFKKADFGFAKHLTDEYYRVVIIKLKPKAVLTGHDYTNLYKIFSIMGEYLKENECCRGNILVCDFFDTSASELVYKMNLVELQQYLPVMTEGYGLRIKGIYLVTASKIIENFLAMFKQLFSAKIGSRIHAITTRAALQDAIKGDVLPKDYGGPEKSVSELYNDILESFSAEPFKKLLEEMNKASTDESKRQTHEFNNQYMGMPGTFRTLSLD